MYYGITNEDHYFIKRNISAIEEILKSSDFIANSSEFANKLEEKVSLARSQRIADKRKDETTKEYEIRKARERKDLAAARISGYLTALCLEYVPEFQSIDYKVKFAIFDCISKYFADYFFVSRKEYEKRLIREKNRIYQRNRRAKKKAQLKAKEKV